MAPKAKIVRLYPSKTDMSSFLQHVACPAVQVCVRLRVFDSLINFLLCKTRGLTTKKYFCSESASTKGIRN